MEVTKWLPAFKDHPDALKKFIENYEEAVPGQWRAPKDELKSLIRDTIKNNPKEYPKLQEVNLSQIEQPSHPFAALTPKLDKSFACGETTTVILDKSVPSVPRNQTHPSIKT